MSVEQSYLQRGAMRPRLRTWILHTLLLLITFVTATIAGVLEPFGRIPFLNSDPTSETEAVNFVLMLPIYYLYITITLLFIAYLLPLISFLLIHCPRLFFVHLVQSPSANHASFILHE